MAAGVRNTGVFGLKSGAVITSTGLIFVALRDGKVRAYDEETGAVLWTANLPAGSEGIPAMYEADGRQFLVVAAASTRTGNRKRLCRFRAPPRDFSHRTTTVRECLPSSERVIK